MLGIKGIIKKQIKVIFKDFQEKMGSVVKTADL